MRELDFGRLDARDEVKYSPDLLEKSYYDFKQAAFRIATGDAWALIGPKGAGKSVTFEYLNLIWESNPEKFLVEWELGGFPVADVTSLKVGVNPGPTSSRAAWEFLLLLKVFESLMRDSGASYPNDVMSLRKDLVAAGLIEGDDLRTRFFDWTKATAKFNIGAFGVEGSTGESGVTALQIVEIVKRGIAMISTSSQHVLAIDGLDSFFAQSDQQLESLAALVEASLGVNGFLADTELRATIVLAIRSDMFAQIPSTDSAKLTDHAVELDWSIGGLGRGNELWGMLNGKAIASVLPSFSGRMVKDLRDDYLSAPFNLADFEGLPSYLLAQTRLLPRDLIALMTILKNEHGGTGLVTDATARAAVRQYSETYFLREVTNGLSKILPGGASGSKVVVFTEALSALKSRYFRAADLKAEIGSELSDAELRALLRQLFLIGGLGVMSGSGPNKNMNFVFRRTAGGGFSFLADYCLHNALVEAWNLRWTTS